MTIQAFVAAFIGFVVACIGVAGLASPATLVAFARNSRSARGFVAAAAGRIVFGLALWLAAANSRAPEAARALGALAFLVGVALLLLGRPRFYALIDWWVQRPLAAVRATSATGVLLGAFSVWAVMP